MLGWIVFGVVVVAAAVGFGILIHRLSRWNDPTWDTPEHQAEAFLWSERSGSGGVGS